MMIGSNLLLAMGLVLIVGCWFFVIDWIAKDKQQIINNKQLMTVTGETPVLQ